MFLVFLLLVIALGALVGMVVSVLSGQWLAAIFCVLVLILINKL